MKQGLSNKPNITRECIHSGSGFTTPQGGHLRACKRKMCFYLQSF